jgi:hypothetical protein
VAVTLISLKREDVSNKPGSKPLRHKLHITLAQAIISPKEKEMFTGDNQFSSFKGMADHLVFSI